MNATPSPASCLTGLLEPSLETLQRVEPTRGLGCTFFESDTHSRDPKTLF